MPDKRDSSQNVLDQTEERFRLLVESVKDYGIFMLDLQGRVASWNAGAERINGYRAEEILGSHFSIFYPPDDILAGKPERELFEAAENGRMEDEGWRVRKDGTRFWADVVITPLRDLRTGQLRGYGKVTRDLTERRAAEEALRHREEEIGLLVESVEEYAIFLLDTEGHVMTWNSGAHRAKGYTAEEIIGQSFSRFYTAEDQRAGKPQYMLEQARLHGRARDQGMRVRKDGSLFPADVLITAVYDAQGRLRGFSKVTRDMTDQERIRQMEMEKLSAEKANEAKDHFLAVLSHELRTPLTPVLAAADYLSAHLRGLSPRETMEHIGTIRRNARLEAQLIDDLLDLTRINRGKLELHLEAVDVMSAVIDAIEICREDAQKKGLHVIRRFDCESCWVWGDPTRLRQIFWNLLTNAVKFTPTGGSITVRSAREEAERIVIEVSDTGIGLDREQITRIFAPFEQGERSVTRQFGGLGLGLAITRSLVEMHQGAIMVDSQGRDRGATFGITFICIAEPEGASKSTPPVANLSKRQLRILLVDDHDDTRVVLFRLLERKGFRVQAAASVTEGSALLRSSAFDVLVSDIGLPDGSGLELMAEAKRRYPKMRGIALSGFGMQEDLDRSTGAGFDLHITKPVDIAALENHLKGFDSRDGDP